MLTKGLTIKTRLGLTMACAQCHTHKYDPIQHTDYYRFLGLMKQPDNSTLTIDGLWALDFGAGNANSGAFNTLFFTSGPNHENDGTFGTLVPVATELNEIDEP